MNRSIKEATVQRYHHDSHTQLERRLNDFVGAYNFGRRLKTLKGLTPYEFICKTWTSSQHDSSSIRSSNAGTDEVDGARPPHRSAITWSSPDATMRSATTMHVTTIGLDLAKHVFQVHGVDLEGNVAIRRELRRAEVMKFFASLSPCQVGMEACSTADHWARELKALGHEVRLMPPTYVKPYVKRGKNDATDAEAICEAVTRPTMRFMPIKSAEQQSVPMLHRSRDLLIRRRGSASTLRHVESL